MIDLIKTVTDIISVITVALLILFSLFLLTAKKGRSNDKIILAFFLLANGIFILNFLSFRYAREVIQYTVNIFFIGESFGFLFGPLLYLYTRSITDKGYRFSKSDILHLSPFIIAFILIVVSYQLQSYDVKIILLKTGLFGKAGLTLFTVAMNIVTLAYLLKAFLLVRQRNRNLKSYYSSVDKINFNWLRLVVTAFFAMWVVDLVNWFLSSFQINSAVSREILIFLSLLINFIFANLLILKSLSLPRLEDEVHHPAVKIKYESSPLTNSAKAEILRSLENLMLNEKLYLNSSLNLGEVANKLSVLPRYLSQVINELKGQNFYDYVNSYRIEEAKKLLRDPGHEKDKILAVLYDCGFNSKSVFNTVFKKSIGITPSEYRRKYRKSA